MYRVETLVHNCKDRAVSSNEVYWVRGKWVCGSKVLGIHNPSCPYCKEKLGDPTDFNYVVSGPVIYRSTSLNMDFTYPGIFIGKVDKRKKEYKRK